MKYDLTIAHRVCPALSQAAVLFSDKLKMVEYCAESMKSALKGINARILLILDGCSDDYEKVFTGRFSYDRLEITKTDAIGNRATYGMQVELLKQVTDTDALYFSEDDYWYKTNAFEAMLDLLEKDDVDFVSPLDHPDRYAGKFIGQQPASIKVTKYGHWRTVESTCLTFMTKRETMTETASMLNYYTDGSDDGTMWLGLTKFGMRNPAVLTRELVNCIKPNHSFGDIARLCALKWYKHRVLTTRRYKLWTPMPTLAVHFSVASLPYMTSEILPGLGAEDRRKLAEITDTHMGI